MSWLKTSVMDQKEMFIKTWESNSISVSVLCERFGVSRTTGHKLIRKYLEVGESCFIEGSKAPIRTPHKTASEIEQAIVQLRTKYKNWGARKIKVLLEKEFNKIEIPSETTVNAILKRNDLIIPKRKRMAKIGKLNPKFDPYECNEIWSSDYKGKFKIGNRRYCNPLTVCDSKSRKILAINCHYNATYKNVKHAYTKVFREYGLPDYLHTDNGSPFGSIRSVRRFSRLCYWLIDVGVFPVFSDPGCPQQNGRHERMHRDLKAFCKNNIKNTLSKQQNEMDKFKAEYNDIRPHEAIDMKTPTSYHQNSKRAFNEQINPYVYPEDYKKLKITLNGSARWGPYHWVYVSTAAKGRYLGAQEIGNGIWNVYYRDVHLGFFDAKLFNRKEMYLKLNKDKV